MLKLDKPLAFLDLETTGINLGADRIVEIRIFKITSDGKQLYAKRKASPGFAFAPDGYLQTELEASFIYEDTPDQLKATNDVKDDMLKDYPMDRLICGDVGFGKTEVAVLAAFKAILDKKQVAILCPTTILALQHHKTFSDRLKEFGVESDYLNRFRSAKERKDITRTTQSRQDRPHHRDARAPE